MRISRVMTHAILVGVLTGVGLPVNAQTSNAPAASEQRRSVGQTAGDSTITVKVKSALIGDEQVKARNIDVDTKRGVVYLKGTVASNAEKDKAVSLARQVAGVREVQDRLTVGSASTGASNPDPSSMTRSPEEKQ